MLNHHGNLSLEQLKHIELNTLTANPNLRESDMAKLPRLLLEESANWSFLEVLSDKDMLQQISTWADAHKNNWKCLVILGIGGSALGARMLYQALGSRTDKQVRIIDNIDPDTIDSIDRNLDFSSTLFLAVSKSGKTPETVAQLAYFTNLLQQKKLDLRKHVICIGDDNNNYLMNFARKNHLQKFFMPSSIGGRFSVLTAVGLVFAALIGLDITQLVEGARAAFIDFENKGQQSGSLNLALNQFYLYRTKNIDQTVIFTYSDRLATVGNWYTQLLAESLGKAYQKDQRYLPTGLTPVPAIGVTDQHSQLQLFAEGPDNKYFIFLSVEEPKIDIKIPPLGDSEFDYLDGVGFGGLLQAELEGTKQSLLEAGRNLSHYNLTKINEFGLGQLIMTLQLSVAALGELLYVNTYDQPGVERSKVLTKAILSRA